MNGRIYDPLLGRFLSGDLVVQNPANLQCFNRYSYVLNNPLTMVDLTGFTFADPKDNVLYKRAEELNKSNNVGDRLKAAGLYLLASPKLMLDAYVNAYRTQLPAKLGEIKKDVAQKNASGEISGAQALLTRAALSTAEIGTAPLTLTANVDRIPKALAEFPGKVVGDVKDAVKNSTANNIYNVVEDAAAIYGGVKAVQGAVGALKNAVAADTAVTTAIADIETPQGLISQAQTPEALAARSLVENGGLLYRTGTAGKSAVLDAQYWALEPPSAPGFASGYGIPAENVAAADFTATGTLKPGASFVTRPASAVGANLGGKIEAVVEAGGVVIQTYSQTPGIN